MAAESDLTPSRSFSIRSGQSLSNLSHDLEVCKPDRIWLSRHTFIRTRTPVSRMKGSVDSEAPGITDELTIHLIKPRELMNILGPIVHHYHDNVCRAQRDTKLILLHDELDTHPLSVRLKSPHRSLKPKGHNGLRSVLKAVPATRHKLIHTIGIGIGRDPSNKSKDSSAVGRWVMSPLKRAELEACSWTPSTSPELQTIHGEVVKETWRNIRNVTRMS